MSQRFTTIYHADPGERYAVSAFDSQIGRQVSIALGGGDQTPAILVKAAVAIDGASVALTFEVDELPEPIARRVTRAMSMGFNLPDDVPEIEESCTNCKHGSLEHWEDDERGRPGCHHALPGHQACLCSLAPSDIKRYRSLIKAEQAHAFWTYWRGSASGT